MVVDQKLTRLMHYSEKRGKWLHFDMRKPRLLESSTPMDRELARQASCIDRNGLWWWLRPHTELVLEAFDDTSRRMVLEYRLDPNIEIEHQRLVSVLCHPNLPLLGVHVKCSEQKPVNIDHAGIVHWFGAVLTWTRANHAYCSPEFRTQVMALWMLWSSEEHGWFVCEELRFLLIEALFYASIPSIVPIERA